MPFEWSGCLDFAGGWLDGVGIAAGYVDFSARMLEDVCEENADAKGAAGDEEDFPSLAGETAR